MHLLMVCAAILAFAVFLDRSRVRTNGLFFVLKDYARRIFRWVTLKRIIYAVGILIFVSAAWQAIGFDWALVAIGGDMMLYLEIASAVYLVAVRGHIQQTTTIVARAITRKIRKSMASLRSRSRYRRSLRHDSSSDDGSDGDAEPAFLGAFAFS